jgi:hypothetical protein
VSNKRARYDVLTVVLVKITSFSLVMVLMPQRSLLPSCSGSMQAKEKQKLEAARHSKYQ